MEVVNTWSIELSTFTQSATSPYAQLRSINRLENMNGWLIHRAWLSTAKHFQHFTVHFPRKSEWHALCVAKCTVCGVSAVLTMDRVVHGSVGIIFSAGKVAHVKLGRVCEWSWRAHLIPGTARGRGAIGLQATANVV